ncbi:hypothetical protein ACWA1F_19040 [Flavobacterium sp. 3-218]
MKKLILFIAFALLFTIFSCTPDEFETQPTKKVEKTIDKAQAGDADPDGPGDTKTNPPTKP